MFRFKDVKYKDILDINELEIKDEKVTCILGKSGGGKTTLLKMLNHMLNYDSGSITYKGQELKEIDPIALRREVVMLAQNPVVFSGTIRDNLLLALEFADQTPVKDKELKKVLKRVYLDKDLEEDAKNLSGGEKQRLALARVILLKPDVLLLDEPSSALDEETEEFIIMMVVDYIKARKGTLVMVTHSTKIAEKYGECIVRINEGRVNGKRREL